MRIDFISRANPCQESVRKASSRHVYACVCAGRRNFALMPSASSQRDCSSAGPGPNVAVCITGSVRSFGQRRIHGGILRHLVQAFVGGGQCACTFSAERPAHLSSHPPSSSWISTGKPAAVFMRLMLAEAAGGFYFQPLTRAEPNATEAKALKQKLAPALSSLNPTRLEFVTRFT